MSLSSAIPVLLMRADRPTGRNSAVWNQLRFPAVLRIDYIRVWQKGEPKVGCDPGDHPTSEYINNHPELYANANISEWEDWSRFGRSRAR